MESINVNKFLGISKRIIKKWGRSELAFNKIYKSIKKDYTKKAGILFIDYNDALMLEKVSLCFYNRVVKELN